MRRGVKQDAAVIPRFLVHQFGEDSGRLRDNGARNGDPLLAAAEVVRERIGFVRAT
jgi:hypothetical protein